MIDLTKYDLDKPEDVQRLAFAIGEELCRDVLENLALALSRDCRMIFYASLLSRPYAFMAASIGPDEIAEVMRYLDKQIRIVGARLKAGQSPDNPTPTLN